MTRVVALVLVVGLVLAAGGVAVWQLVADGGGIRSGSLGGSGEGSTTTPEPSDEPTGSGGSQTAPDPRLQEFYDQRITWEACGDDECARIEVPLDYDHPGRRRIELALLRNAADVPAQRVGPLLVNPGGPGSPGTRTAADASFYFGDPVLERFDIIGFDPRGTGSSTAVDCLTDAQLDEYIAGDPDPDTPAEVQEFADSLELMGQGCAERSGALAPHVSTVEAARDLDVIRAVLGQDTLDYFGFSYGTKLGATYADLFPDRAGRLVLDGAVDLDLPNRDLALQQARGFEVALTAYVDDCLDGDCFLGSSRAEALGAITGFLDEVDREPIPVGDRNLEVGNAFYGIVAPLYNDDYWPLLTQALTGAMNGNAQTLMFLSDTYTSRNPDGTYADNSSEAIYAINCLDDPWHIDIDQVPAQYADFEEASPTFGRVFAWGLTGCSGLAVEPAEQRPTVTAEGAAPILVIGTTRDPATPYRWAVALADQLASAVLVSRDGDGHTGYNQGNKCVDDVVEEYLFDGAVPDGDVDCPAA